MKTLLIAMTMLMILATGAQAQLEAGDAEIQFSSQIFAGEDMAQVTLQLLVGYYLMPEIQAGLGPLVRYYKFGSGEGSSYTSIGMFGFGRYYFLNESQVAPYLSGQIYQFDLTPDEGIDFIDFTFIQLGGGIKYFFSDYIAYDASAHLGTSLGDIGGNIGLYVNTGVSAFF